MLTAIVDLQFGSTGKGLFAGYLSTINDYDTVVSANMPNAGHTYVNAEGRKVVNKVLPSGVYSPGLKNICIGPGAVFDPQQLMREEEELTDWGITKPRLVIHPNAAILKPHHKDSEAALNHIASTMQGSMEAMVDKMRRHDTRNNIVGLNLTHMGRLKNAVVDHNEWHRIMREAQNVLVEGSQGYSLGINAGFYPYCTSRDCTVWRLLADAGIHPHPSIKVIGTARVHPIRVGNTPNGFSGGCYPDQKEISWSDLGIAPEQTTVTKRDRRVFTFSEQQIVEAMEVNMVHEVFLNFCNYAPGEAARIAGRINAIGSELRAKRDPIWADSSYPFSTVRYMGFGPQVNHIISIGT